jgi:hypothetical protein
MLDYFAVAGTTGTPGCFTDSSTESTGSTERSKSSTGKHCDNRLSAFMLYVFHAVFFSTLILFPSTEQSLISALVHVLATMNDHAALSFME